MLSNRSKKQFSRLFSLVLVAVLLLQTGLLSGCSTGSGNSSNGGNGSGNTADPTQQQQVKIGTMATEDMLPFWVAENQGLFTDANLDVEIIVFQSANELSTAIAAGEIDMAMTDLMVSISLAAGGITLEICWVTLGQTAGEGRFGILAHPDRGINNLQDLAGVPVGIGSNTLPEYTFDRLMAAAGVPADQVLYDEIKIVPVRFEMLMNNQIAAAALPASLLYMGEQKGMVLVADDLAGENISQTVMVARADDNGALLDSETMQSLRQCWDKAVDLINADPENWRELLTEKAQLPLEIAGSYPITHYSHASRAEVWMVGNVQDWMREKGYLTASVSYSPQTGLLTSSSSGE